MCWRLDVGSWRLWREKITLTSNFQLPTSNFNSFMNGKTKNIKTM